MNVASLVRNEGFRRGLRHTTIKTYIYTLQKFFRVIHKNPIEVTKNDIEKYISTLKKWNKSDNTINIFINSVKFFYCNILHRNLTININHRRVRKKLPEFLTQNEVTRLFAEIKNKKHALMIRLLYATGMRVGELIKLNVKHFEFDQNYGWVRDGKGGKDRMFIIAAKLKDELLHWVEENNLEGDNWLFPGQSKSTHISDSTIRIVLVKAAKSAEIRKKVHPHMLRHSFATHLIENGYAVTEVQPLLGHNSPNTTMIYLHMASPQLLNVKSPYDTLEKKKGQEGQSTG